MILNIDIPLSKKAKNKMIKIKDKTHKTYSEQIKEIFSKAKMIKLEHLADAIIKKYKQNTYIKNTKITVRIDSLFDETYFRKIHFALLTKVPRLEFREMLCIIIEIAFEKE